MIDKRLLLRFVGVSRSWSVHALWGVAATVSVLLVSAVAFVLGGIMGQQQLYQSWTDRKLDKLATILESDELKGVEAEYTSAAQVYLTGTIKDNVTHCEINLWSPLERTRPMQ